MIKFITASLCLLNFLFVSGQIRFEPAYYINEKHEKVECFIKNTNSRNSPTQFSYKLQSEGEEFTASIDSIQEFGFYDDYIYIRYDVDVDASEFDIDEGPSDGKPLYESKTVFLKPLVLGEASLYVYTYDGAMMFFYSLEGSHPEQLYCKEYLTPSQTVKVNRSFVGQLSNCITCSDISIPELSQLNYSKRELEAVFLKYNRCHTVDYVNPVVVKKKGKFRIAIKPGIRHSYAESSRYASNAQDAEFETKINLNYAFEFEFVLPFKSNKWSIAIEPGYHSYVSMNTLPNDDVKIDFKAIEVPVGLKYYMFLNDCSRLRLSISYAAHIGLNSSVFYPGFYPYKINTLFSPRVGLGYSYNQKYTVDFTCGKIDNLFNPMAFDSRYVFYELSFGYTLFQK